MTDVARLEGQIGHTFQHREHLLAAVRHKSYVHEHPDQAPDNERLEFLGDAVLCLAVSALLMQRHPDLSEGALSRWRSQLINTAFLAQQARAMQLGTHLQLGKGEEQAHGREKPSLLADAFEAVIGALYVELGFDRLLPVLARLLHEGLQTPPAAPDAKSAFQMALHAQFRLTPQYLVLREEGPAHQRSFVVSLSVGDQVIAEGAGASKREAEQQAAASGLTWLGGEQK